MREEQLKLSNRKINKIISDLLFDLEMKSGYYDVEHGLLSDKVIWVDTIECYVESFMEEHYFFLRAYKIEEDSWNKLLNTFEEELRETRLMDDPDYSEHERFWSRNLIPISGKDFLNLDW